MSRLLLVSPVFHGYWKALGASLEHRGHRVTTCRYDELRGASAKTRHKLGHELPLMLGLGHDVGAERRVTRLAVDAVRAVRPDAVVVVKGDLLGDDFWSEISGLPRVLWMYDEVRRTRWDHRSMDGIGPICSYSQRDTQALLDAGLTSRHLPLAFDHRLQPHPPVRRTPEIVFIGARYPTRVQALEMLVKRGIATRAIGRDWSRHPVDRLRTWELRRPHVPSGRDMDRRAAYDAMASATATVNMHGDQDGFTMRTFEACGVGGVQLIDRTDLGDLYDDGVELVSYTSLEDLHEACLRVQRDTRWADSLRRAGRARTLAHHTFDHRAAVLESTLGR